MNLNYYIYIKTRTTTCTICAIPIDKLNNFVENYKRGENPMVNGKIYFLSNLLEIRIYEIDAEVHSKEEISKYERGNYYGNDIYISPEILNRLGKDVTDTYIKKVFVERKINNNCKERQFMSNNVFIVHGRNEALKETVARFIEHLGLCPIILSEKENEGMTIIEKIESQNADYAIILYTPCDICQLPNSMTENRARQNVLFEHGYFIGKLGRKKSCTIVDGSVTLPSDVIGLGYVKYDGTDGWKLPLAKELKKAGYDIDLNKLA